MTAPAHPAAGRHEVPLGLLWFGLLGAPLAWSLQLLIGYAFSANRCFPGTQLQLHTPTTGINTALVVMTVVALLIAAAAGVTAWRSWKATHHEEGGKEEEALEVGEGRTRFMALSGMLLSVLFGLAVFFSGLSPFVVPACGAGQ